MKRSTAGNSNKWGMYDREQESTGFRKRFKERPPPELRGKAIGLWYAARNKARRYGNSTERDKEMRAKRQASLDRQILGTIQLSETKKQKILQYLDETASTSTEIDNFYNDLKGLEFEHNFLNHINGNIYDKLKRYTQELRDNDEQLDTLYYDEFVKKKNDPNYTEMLKFRHNLPAMKMKTKIVDLINQNQVVVISGETGCGKTTQVAQFILDDWVEKKRGSLCKVICTQPRRISAISVAERVASERAESLGQSVGYQIRLEKHLPRQKASILFCTTGILLKYMESDPTLQQVSHLVLDEIHERDVISDFLITVLRDVIKYRKDLKVILMSATINSEAFSKYYGNAPHLNIPGFTYPVKEYFLEDVLQMTKFSFQKSAKKIFRKDQDFEKSRTEYIEPYIRQLKAENKYGMFVINELLKPQSESLNMHLIYSLLEHICLKDKDDGAILVFVPGFSDIQDLCKMARNSGKFPPHSFIIIPIHSQLSSIDQRQIFNPAPKGKRKIIISTNIAETSITIDDVTTVINCGFIKYKTLDLEMGCESLKPHLVSQANANQRRGRAGRVKPGVCYHLLIRARYEILDKFMQPEVLRERLEDVVLQLKLLQLGEAESFLANLMDPPDKKSVHMSVTLLHRLGALDTNENLTPLGYHMSRLPVGAQPAKMLILGSLFSCLDPILSVAASLGFKDAFQLSMDSTSADHAKLELADGCKSDHLLMHFAVRGYEESTNGYAFCRKYYLSENTLSLIKSMRQQFADMLCDMNFIENHSPRAASHNRNSQNLSLVKAIICAGLYPNIFIIKKHYLLRSVMHEPMKFHPKSILSKETHFESKLGVYHTRLMTQGIQVHDATLVHSWPLAFFGDDFHEGIDNHHHFVVISKKIRFKCSKSTANVVKLMRERLNEILNFMVTHPGPINWDQNTSDNKILSAIIELITSQDMDHLDLSDFDDSN